MRAQTIKALSDRMISQWGSTPFPISFENAPYNQTGAAWGRFSIWLGERQPSAVGQRFTRFPGVVWLQCFIPENKGAVIAQKAADKLDEIFQFERLKVSEPGLEIDIQIESGAKGPEHIRTVDGMAQFNISFRLRADATA